MRGTPLVRGWVRTDLRVRRRWSFEREGKRVGAARVARVVRLFFSLTFLINKKQKTDKGRAFSCVFLCFRNGG